MKRPWLLLVGACALTLLLLGLAHLLGWRESVSVLSGTVPAAGGAIAEGVLYALLWFASVVAVPIALLATAIYALALRLLAQAEPLETGPRT